MNQNKYNDHLKRLKANELKSSEFDNSISDESLEPFFLYEVVNPSAIKNGEGFSYVEKAGVQTLAITYVKLVKTLKSTLISESGSHQHKTVSGNIDLKKDNFKVTRNIKVEGWAFEDLNVRESLFLGSYIDYSNTTDKFLNIDVGGKTFFRINSFTTVDNRDKTAKSTKLSLTYLNDDAPSDFTYQMFYNETMPSALKRSDNNYKIRLPYWAMVAGFKMYGRGNVEEELDTIELYNIIDYDKVYDSGLAAENKFLSIHWAFPINVNDSNVTMASEWQARFWHQWEFPNNVTDNDIEIRPKQAVGVKHTEQILFAADYNRTWDSFSMFERSVNYKNTTGYIGLNPKFKEAWHTDTIIAQLLQGRGVIANKEQESVDYKFPGVFGDSEVGTLHKLNTYTLDKIEPYEKIGYSAEFSKRNAAPMAVTQEDTSNLEGVNNYTPDDGNSNFYYWLTAMGMNTDAMSGKNYNICHAIMINLQFTLLFEEDETKPEWEKAENGEFGEGIWKKVLGLHNVEFEPRFNFAGGDKTVRQFEITALWNYGMEWGMDLYDFEYKYQLGRNIIPPYWDKTRLKLNILW